MDGQGPVGGHREPIKSAIDGAYPSHVMCDEGSGVTLETHRGHNGDEVLREVTLLKVHLDEKGIVMRQSSHPGSNFIKEDTVRGIEAGIIVDVGGAGDHEHVHLRSPRTSSSLERQSAGPRGPHPS